MFFCCLFLWDVGFFFQSETFVDYWDWSLLLWFFVFLFIIIFVIIIIYIFLLLIFLVFLWGFIEFVCFGFCNWKLDEGQSPMTADHFSTSYTIVGTYGVEFYVGYMCVTTL